jgi:mono/diheme cytochrome c family protein
MRLSSSARLVDRIAAALMRALVPLLTVLLALSITGAAWADEAPGKAAYQRVCAQCHGDDPEDGGDGPPLIPMQRTTRQVLAIVRGGRRKMHPLTETKVSDAEVAAVVAYLQALTK